MAEPLIHKNSHHPAIKTNLTIGQKAADNLASFVGSWTFILLFVVFLILWILLNSFWFFFGRAWDPYPFIVLNLVLSTLASAQAPIILMNQNRQAERDRIMVRYDYQVNRKAEHEVTNMQKDLDEIKFMIRNSRITPPIKDFKDYSMFKSYQKQLEKMKSLKGLPKSKNIRFEAIQKIAQKPIKRKNMLKKKQEVLIIKV